MNNLSKQYIVGSMEERVNQDISGNSQLVDTDNSNTWFYSPMDCLSKWSKALKWEVTNSMGLEKVHTANTVAGDSEKPDFSFFL